MAYMIPFSPEQVRFLRIQRYFETPPNDTDNLMHSIVDHHNGKLFTIYRLYEKEFALEALKEYRLKLDSFVVSKKHMKKGHQDTDKNHSSPS